MSSAVASTRELEALLRDNAEAPDRQRIRIQGLGTRARGIAPPAPDVRPVTLRRLDRIERLEPDDLTCSVQPGVPCRELAGELQRRGLELGGLSADDPGTVGGLYATDPLGPGSLGGACPRSTLLGCEGMLADGTAFRAGARVVKSVAGFDVHRLLVGSRGRLFAATLLHLKLRPAPRASVPFAARFADLAPALARFLTLRSLPSAPRQLALRRAAAEWTLFGTFAGRAAQVAAAVRQHDVAALDRRQADHLDPPAPGFELVVGRTRATRIAALVASLPDAAPFLVHAGGHFETVLAPRATDALLTALQGLDAHGAVALGEADRLHLATELDHGAATLQRTLQRALDPRETLA